MSTLKMTKIAVNGGISFGSNLNAKQLMTLASFLPEGAELELTTFQQLYLEIEEDRLEEIKKELEQVGLHCYPVGNFVKSLRTCNFCKGSEEEGMPVAKEINSRIAGISVPFTLRPAYTGCPVGCGEPMVSDIGIMKMKDMYNLYVGGKSKGLDAEAGKLVGEKLTPEDLYARIEKMVHYYSKNGKKREPFHKFISRVGLEEFLVYTSTSQN
jgi:precorrin-3B C17-methyltransferase